ncbi:MAG TPA: hypothetical protein VHW00_23615 [Thermoanaerobaculia bacterium]|nr:hypothetical protein [Thermoanaerobaculia bacterium]
MFDSIRPDDAPTRLRNAAIVPLAAFLFVQLYFSFTTFLPRVPAALFWSVAVVLFAATVTGAVLIVRASRREQLRGRTLAWFVAAIVSELVCLRFFLLMVLPWI